MFLLSKLFFMSTKKLSIRERTQERIRLQNLHRLYSAKVKQLSQRTMHNRTVLLTCSDAPVKISDMNNPSAMKTYVKACLNHYKKKLREISKELKKVL